jgi:hypothetical protein
VPGLKSGFPVRGFNQHYCVTIARLSARERQTANLGVAQVCLLLSTGGLPPLWQPTIVEWLAQKDQEERRAKDALDAKQKNRSERGTNDGRRL